MGSEGPSSSGRTLASVPRLPVLLSLVVFAAAFIAHAPALDHDFLTWDDDTYVTENPHIQSLDGAMVGWALTSYERHNWHPLTWISHSIDYWAFGKRPGGHHFVNVALHAFNAVWVFLLALVALPLFGMRSGGESMSVARSSDSGPLGTEPRVVTAALVAALLFGVHPQHVESVAWVAERKDVLFLFFALPSLGAYLLYACATSVDERRRWYAASLACFTLSALSKPMAVTLPVVMLLLDVHPLGRTRLAPVRGARLPGAREHLMLIVEKIPFAALAALSSAMTILAQRQTMASVGARGLGLRLLNAFDALTAYVAAWAWPRDLSPFYPFKPGYKGLIQNAPDYALPIVFVTATTLLTLWLWLRGRRAYMTAWLFYVITLFPVLGLVSVGSQSHADRYAYLPTLPLHLLAGAAVGAAAYGVRASVAARAALGGVCAVGILLLGAAAHEQSSIWRSDVTVWQRAVEMYPEQFMTRTGLAHAHVQARDYELAAAEYTAAFENLRGRRRDPFIASVRLTFAGVLANIGELDRASEVLELIRVGVDPASRAQLHGGLARLYCSEGEMERAAAQAEKAAALATSDLALRELRRTIVRGDCPRQR